MHQNMNVKFGHINVVDLLLVRKIDKGNRVWTTFDININTVLILGTKRWLK